MSGGTKSFSATCARGAARRMRCSARGRAARFAALVLAVLLGASLAMPTAAFAATGGGDAAEAVASEDAVDASGADREAASADVTVSAETDAAMADGASFALADYSRAQKGSNRDVDGAYIGYSYYQGADADYLVAVVTENYVVVHVPESAMGLCDVSDPAIQSILKSCLLALDEAAVNGGVVADASVPWEFTTERTWTNGDVVYSFGVEAGEGRYYTAVTGADGGDVVSATANAARPLYVDFAHVVAPDAVDIVPAATGLAAAGEFLSNLDWSPLWVTLKTTGVAIVFIFVLGLAAAYFSLRIPKRAQDIADTLFTIPMVLPPTVCGFILLLALGNNSLVGRWFIEHGLPLVFSWPATVIAAVVVAFPLMYRSARGAFENIDPLMLDAARTLGWSNARIFFRLMMPLAWSSIAAGAVLAFARALGEFGATLFLAGNYAGITRTIPIAIYFEWMGGNMDAALFWTGVVIVFSFIVILFINLWSRRTTKYRRPAKED